VEICTEEGQSKEAREKFVTLRIIILELPQSKTVSRVCNGFTPEF
jgi:hypothetical protein